MKIDIPYEADWVFYPAADQYILRIGPYVANVVVRDKRTSYWVDHDSGTRILRILTSHCVGSDCEIEVEAAQHSCEDAIRDDVISRRLAAARAAQQQAVAATNYRIDGGKKVVDVD